MIGPYELNSVICGKSTRLRYPTISINGKQKRLHRYVMETHIGRELSKSELVHHVDGDINNNNIENLMIVSRAEHKKIHSDIGVGCRFIKKYHLDSDKILELYKRMTMEQIAANMGCSYQVVWKCIKDNDLRNKIKCKVCGIRAHYIRKQLCVKHYLKEYYASKRISK